MKKITELKSRNLRLERNSELVRRMRNGEQLTSFNSQASWYPPRPIIEKNQEAIHKLYGRAAKALKPEMNHEDFETETFSQNAKSKESHLQLAD